MEYRNYRPILITQIFMLSIYSLMGHFLHYTFSSSGWVTGVERVKHKDVETGEKTVDARGCATRSTKRKQLKETVPQP